MNKKILILGGNGYIGSQTNLELLENGFETVVFDKQKPSFLDFIFQDFKSDYFFGDLLNPNNLKEVFEKFKIQAVIHFAANIEVNESQINPEKYYFNNVVGTLNLLQVMKNFEVKNLVFSSTAAVYGLPTKIPILETDLKKPINVYGRTKWVVEQILQDYNKAYGLNSISLRYFNACGADLKNRCGENHHPESHLIPLILMTANQKKEVIKIFGENYQTKDGTCIRDYIHTKDLATAHLLALKKLIQNLQNENNSENICEAVNLGTKNGYSVKEIIQKAKEITGIDFKTEVVEKRLGDPDKLIADNNKAQKWLGFSPKHSKLEKILKTAWEWEKIRV
jgi:UDP-glucose 4-epimerase